MTTLQINDLQPGAIHEGAIWDYWISIQLEDGTLLKIFDHERVWLKSQIGKKYLANFTAPFVQTETQEGLIAFDLAVNESDNNYQFSSDQIEIVIPRRDFHIAEWHENQKTYYFGTLRFKDIFEIIEPSNLPDKTIFYPWIINSNLENLIHPDYLNAAVKTGGFGIVKCLYELQDYLFIAVNNVKLLVKKTGPVKVLPDPKYKTSQEVLEIKSDLKYIIDTVGWHHKEGKYFYYLRIGNNVKSKRYFESELKSVL